MERKIVVDSLRLSYQGIFNMNEFYLMMDKWHRERGYDKFEKKNYEHVYKDGRQIEIEIEPWKKITDYAKMSMKVTILVTGLKDIVVKKDGRDAKMQQGKLLINFMGYMDTDYENRWDNKPYFFFLRAVFDMYVYKINQEKYEAAVAEEVQHLYNLMKSYLNMQRYSLT